MYTETSYLNPVPPFDFTKSLDFLEGFKPTKDEQSISSHSLTKAISIDGQPIVFQISDTGTIETPQLEYTLFSDQPIAKSTQVAAVERMTFFLSLSDDLKPFYKIGREDPAFAPILEHLHGYHQVKFLTPFETACWAVLTQRNPMVIARKMKSALVEYYGNSLNVDGTTYSAFPEPVQLARVNESDLLALIRNGQRAEYLSAIARAFIEVDEEFLPTAPEEEVRAWLRSIRGIGEWSADFILVRGLGRMEHLPLTEKKLVEAVSQLYGMGEPMSRQAIEHVADRYGPWQGYWAHYLRVAS